MSEPIVEETHIAGEARSRPPRAFFPLLIALFIGSGCAALIYAVVWFQLLGLVIGSSSISRGVLLGTFMGGMCLGSLLLPRLVSTKHHPLRVYALLELGIGFMGLAILYGMPLIGGVYTSWAGSGLAGMFLWALVASICLLPPAIMVGATLPAVARWREAQARQGEASNKAVCWIGLFYAGNIAGAAAGSLLTGFLLASHL